MYGGTVGGIYPFLIFKKGVPSYSSPRGKVNGTKVADAGGWCTIHERGIVW